MLNRFHGETRVDSSVLLLASDGSGLPACPSVAQLLRVVDPALIGALCREVLPRFHQEADLLSMPVVDAESRPVAIIDRHHFLEFFSRPYSKEVFGQSSLGQLLSRHREALSGAFPIAKPMAVDIATPIDDVARIVVDTGIQHMVNGIVVTRDERYVGVVHGHDLLHEITQRKQAELHFLAHYDALTRIPNRMLFSDRLNQACREASRNDREFALLFIDVDRFKQVNDSMGHRFGDELLVAIAACLRGCARESDTVARLGGDEFAILMESVRGPEDAEALARRLVDSMRRPFRIMGREIAISLSIGVAMYPRDDSQVDLLLSKADAAMYEVKVSGRNGFRQFSPTTTSFSSERSSLEAELKQALANGEFTLCYQPQLDLVHDRVVGVEALIRWNHPRHGLLGPGSFIGIAEESGLIVRIGDWVVAEACRQHRDWLRQGLPALRMAVNISPLQFRQPDFIQRVTRLLGETSVDPAFLEFELTESMVMHEASLVLDMLNELRVLGVRLSLDDFGTGFSSLGYLNRYPIDRLKIDQSFVRGIDSMPINQSIVRSIVALAKSLSLQVVAEGVETEAELAFVRESQCDEFQGYLFARPMRAEDLAEWLGERHLSQAEQRQALLAVP
jgi:diguanylate cyclase (GGDEF)-like protein